MRPLPVNATALGPRATPTAVAGKAWLLLFTALLLGYALVIVSSPNAPLLQDYPDWVFQAVLFGKWLTGNPVPHYTLRHYPVPNSLTTVGVGLLTLLLHWKLAARVWLLLILGALGLALVRLMRSLRAESYAVVPVIATSLIVGLDFWNGSVNFQLGLAFLLLFIDALLTPIKRPTVLGVLLLLCFFTHMLPCGAALLMLLAFVLQTSEWKLLLAALPTLLCLAWYAVARDAAESRGSFAHLLPAVLAVAALLAAYGYGKRNRSARPATALLITPATLSRLPASVFLLLTKAFALLSAFGLLNIVPSRGGTNIPLFAPPVFVSFCVVAVVAGFVYLSLQLPSWLSLSRPVRGSEDQHSFLLVTSLALMLLFVLSPVDALGVTGIDSRFLHLSLAVGLCVLGTQQSRRLLCLAVISVLMGGVNLYQFARLQTAPASVSITDRPVPPIGAAVVAPAIRSDYYSDLEQGHLDRWIFSTALFRWLPH